MEVWMGKPTLNDGFPTAILQGFKEGPKAEFLPLETGWWGPPEWVIKIPNKSAHPSLDLPHCFDMGMDQKSIGHESTRLLRGSASETVCWCILTTQPANLLPIEPYYAKQLINFTGGSRLTGVNIDASHYIDRCQKNAARLTTDGHTMQAHHAAVHCWQIVSTRPVKQDIHMYI